ncbi:hypothetical protein MATL_G00166490 [Megalops atlanticus]|uniref:HOOK N-terminal domain-containing protein n=1 Tax=Megalops atlanticus TaxID=7932 RepID=A0A9D3PQ75_MEGAT|nr:hypothetical protein MATL_G00166490 [Megalops atlanticus]
MERVTKMDAQFSDILEEFMRSELVTWVHLFDSVIDGEGEGPLSTQYLEVNSNSQHSQGRYLRLTNGIFLNEVMRIIDPNPKVEQIFRNESNDEVLRVQNFSVLNRHLRSFYQEDLQQLLLMPLPNVAVLGRDPLTEAAVEELRRLLLLLLGCAVQCERKEVFIQQIQSLEIETQAAIATCIQEITQDLSNVLPLQWEELCALEGSELQGLFSTMAQHIQGLLSQRDTHLERIAELSVECDSVGDTPHTPSPSIPEGVAVQLADCRAKLRRLRQELEDKGDQLLDYKQEVHAMEVELKKLRQENRALQGEARAARGLRDELDCLRERAAKADRLQAELQSCAHRLRSLDLCRTQLQEQQQYCATLQETRALLEEQLGEVRARCSSLRELERDNLLLRQRLIDLEGERDAERQRVDELLEENMSLEAELKHNLGGARNIQLSGMDSGDEFIHETDLKPLSVEVSEASSWKLLGAETENAELRRRLEQLQAERELCTEGVGPVAVYKTELLDEREKLKEELQKQTVTRTSLEAEYQNTLNELQNMKDENSRLRSCLDSLRAKQQWEQKGEKTAKVERSDREAEEKKTQREEGEGGREGEEKVTGGEEQGKEQERESGMDGIRTKREDGEGEEILSLRERVERFKQVQGDQEAEPKERDEGEGEKESGGIATAKELGCRKDETGSMLKTKERGESLKEREATEGEDEREMEAPRGLTEDLEGDGSALASQLQRALLEVEQQSQECDRQAGLAQELESRLAEQNQRALRAEQQLSVLEAENLQLKKTMESLGDARKQIETLQAESVQMEEELARLRSQAELHRLEAAMITQLQGERAQLERERDALRSSTDTLRAAARKGDQLELTNQSLKAEVERLGRSLESSRRREAELEAELREAGLEAESLGRVRDQAVLEAARLEQEKEVFQSQLDAHRREGRQREREAARLRQQLESTASALERSNQRACSLEAEHRQVCQELSQLQEDCTQLREDCTKLREDCAKLHELERENGRLSSLNSEAQSQLSTLAQELANEKTQAQEWAEQVAKLSQRLERLQAEQSTALSSSLSPMLRGGETETDTASLIPPGGTRQPKLPHIVTVNETEPQTQEPSQLPGVQISDSLPLPRGDPRPGTESTPLSQGESGVQSKLPQNTNPAGKTSTHQMKNETLPVVSVLGTDKKEFLSERLVEVERQNAALQAERDVLRLQLQQAQSTCAHLQEQLDSLHRHSIALQENCANLQALNTKLQTEQATLSSQHALVWARCSESEARVAALEAESKVWARDREEVLLRGEGLRRDHERLTALQQRQETELEALLSKHSQLKANFRNVEMQHRELEGRYRELSDRRAQLEEGEAAVQVERERMEREAQTQAERERELERLREGNDKLHALQKESLQVQAELMAQGSVLRGELSAAQLERTRLEGELNTLREQNQHLDLNNARLASQYQLLTQLKGNMEEETRHLMEQNQNLARENRALLERSLESRDQHHLQQREYLDKLNELRREKQKLVEKIMDQYRVLEPSVPLPNKTKKSNWIADRMKKLIKPRGGREVREGRAQFIAAGSVENLTEASDYTQYAPAAQQDPLSAPVSPSPLRKSSSTESEEQACVVLRSGRRKLASRHGWGLGRGRGGVSQSFSPGDQRPCPRDRFHSQGGATAIWQSEGSSAPSHESLVEEEKAECEDNVMAGSKSDPHRLSSGPEESFLNNDKSLVTKTDSLQSI